MPASFRAVLTAILVTAFLFLSCAQSEPEIRASSIRLLRVQTSAGDFVERLSVFLYFNDEDGTEDFSTITVRHVDTGLFWVLDAADADVRIRGRDRWTGTSIFAPPLDGVFPGGDYTVAVADLAGNEAVQRFTLVRSPFPEKSPIRFSLSGDIWTLERNRSSGEFTDNYLFLFDAGNTLVHVWKMPENEMKVVGDLDVFRQEYRDAVTIQAYSQTRDGQAGVLLSPAQME